MAFFLASFHNISMLDGIILLDKKEGVTSRSVDNLMQRKFQTRKVGHLGTLDPFATGLFIVSINKGCKALPFLEDGKKTYQAKLRLGYYSSTGDKDGEIREGKKISNLDQNKIETVFASFIGKSHQLPPMTSAIKVDGKPLYQLAHQGKEIERKSREIEIFSLKLLSYDDESLEFETEVSKGTYIRVLGEDIAKALGGEGYLTSLRRTKIGPFDVSLAKKEEEVSEADIIDPIHWIALPHLEIDDEQLNEAINGKKMHLKSAEDKILLTQQGKSIAVYEKIGPQYYQSLRGLF